MKSFKEVIHADLAGYDSLIEERRLMWLADLLLYMGVDVDTLMDNELDRIRTLLIENKIEIVFYQTMLACKVFYDGILVGEWLGPEYNLKEDDSGLFYEITLEAWSLDEEDLDEQD